VNNVVRENKTLNRGGSGVTIGQIGLTAASNKAWPIIQLYDLTVSGNVVVQYNKGGGVQTTTLKYDTVGDFISEQLDRSVYPRGAQIHYTVTDVQLNIDPTDEDTWSFQTTNQTTHYQVFDENGGRAGDLVALGVADITSKLGDLMIEDGGALSLNVNTQGSTPVVSIQDNADVALTSTSTSAASACTVGGASLHGKLCTGTQPVTLTESSPNTGIFGTYDENDVSQLEIT
jgi:hypothetical protein